jgi:hypothetical protein
MLRPSSRWKCNQHFSEVLSRTQKGGDVNMPVKKKAPAKKAAKKPEKKAAKKK